MCYFRTVFNHRNSYWLHLKCKELLLFSDFVTWAPQVSFVFIQSFY